MRKRKRFAASIVALALALTGSVGIGMSVKADSCGGLEEMDVYWPEEGDVVKDPILHWAIRAAMNSVKSKVTFTEEMVGDKSVHDISYELCNHTENFVDWTMPFYVENLEGIQYAKSARAVDISYTSATEGKKIADVSPLAALTQLEFLKIKQNGIEDISSLNTLVNLKSMDISENKAISDISAIKNMTKLEALDISSNKVENVDALKNLENLTYLNISNNHIKVLPDMSKLSKVITFSAGNNQLTDISQIANMKNLVELDLSSNTGITDLKPLAKLYNLDKNKTYISNEAMKEDLFAVIEVNKKFNKFNISTMQKSDLEDVDTAIEAYEALTSGQKAYIEKERVDAAKDNKARVERGEEPKYYPEYDEGGVKAPVLDRLEIKVVDKKGNPMPNVTFIRKPEYGTGSENITDDTGILTFKHTIMSQWDGTISIYPESKEYLAFPSQITYTVSGSLTSTINGKAATGYEALQFMLIPKEDYVDKTQLAAALKEAENAEEEYKYTEISWKVYKEAYDAARQAFDDTDASRDTVNTVTENLKKAYSGLEKTDILTELKLTVKDVNGNIFTRPFKFQIRVPETGAEAWNQLSDAYTGETYLKTSPVWEDGKTWEILSCYEEPYEIEPIVVTIGVDGSGKRYYKTINGENASVDSELEVTVKALTDGAPDKVNERKPDSAVLSEYIENAKQYKIIDYTPATYQALDDAIKNAENTIQKQDALQEDYNACAAAIKQAETALTILANKLELKGELDIANTYNEAEAYTTATWEEFVAKRETATQVYNDKEVVQEQVDNALKELTAARKGLVRRADKEEKKALLDKLNQARALKEEDYKSGYAELQDAIASAQNVYDNADATGAAVKEQITELDDAIKALVKKPQDVEYDCLSYQFRAKVIDSEGNPVAGVKFISAAEGEEGKALESDENGIISEYAYLESTGEKTIVVRLADDRYTTEDEHSYTAKNPAWVTSITAVDGQPFQEGIRLTYTVTAKGETPDPQPVDKSALKEQMDLAKTYDGKEAEYTEVTYQALQTALKEAGEVYNNDTATKEQVEEKTTALKNAIAALEKKKEEVDYSCLDWQFRAKVVDKDGNPISGVNFLHAAEGETEGDTLTSDDNGIIKTTLPYLGEGQEQVMSVSLMDDRYSTEDTHQYTATYVASRWTTFITAIDGQPYQDGIRLLYTVTEKGQTPEPQPVDKTVLKEQIDLAKTYDGKGAEYTEASYQALQTVLKEAEGIYYDDTVTKEQVEEKATALKNAIAALEKKREEVDYSCLDWQFRAKVMDKDGNPVSGVKFVNMVEGDTEGDILTSDENGIIKASLPYLSEGQEQAMVVSLADDRYSTEDSHKYNIAYVASRYVTCITSVDGQPYQDGMKLTYTVTAKGETPEPQPIDKTALKAQIDLAKTYDGKETEYTEVTYQALQTAVKEAEEVYNNVTATKEQVDEKTTALKNAIAALEKKPEEVNDDCLDYQFRARVIDKNGNPVSGVKFESVQEGSEAKELSSDDNGMIMEYPSLKLNEEKTVIIRLADDRYTTEDEHSYTAKNASWIVKITAVDGQPFQRGIRLTYTVTAKGETPDPQPVDKSKLEEAINAAKALDAAKYTDESYAKIAAALIEAETVFKDENATQEEVDVKTSDLNAAISAKVEKPSGGDEEKPSDKPNTDGDNSDKPSDGKVNVTTNNQVNKAVKTGDTARITPFILMMMVSVILIGTVIVFKKKNKR